MTKPRDQLGWLIPLTVLSGVWADCAMEPAGSCAPTVISTRRPTAVPTGRPTAIPAFASTATTTTSPTPVARQPTASSTLQTTRPDQGTTRPPSSESPIDFPNGTNVSPTTPSDAGPSNDDDDGAEPAENSNSPGFLIAAANMAVVLVAISCFALCYTRQRRGAQRAVPGHINDATSRSLCPVDFLSANVTAAVGPLEPDVLISYSTKVNLGCADDERGKQLTLHIASLLDARGITYYHGLMVPPGDNWWHNWFGRVAGCKVAIVVLSPAYFASKQCIRELNALLEHKKELQIIPVVAAAGAAEVLQGSFLGTTHSRELQARGIRALFKPNWLPPPDEVGGVYDMASTTHHNLLIETVLAKLSEHPLRVADSESTLTTNPIQQT